MKIESFVGRENEIDKLVRLYRESMKNESQCCFILGDPGTGKTTLVNNFIERIDRSSDETVCTVAQCYDQLGISDPYLPFLKVIEDLSGGGTSVNIEKNKDAYLKRKKQSFHTTFGKAILEFAPDLIGTLIPGSYIVLRAASLTAKEMNLMNRLKKRKNENTETINLDQNQIFIQFSKLFKSLCEKCPLIIVLDDMQWADNSSINLLFHLVFRLEKSKIFFIACYRPNDVALGREGKRHPLEQVVNELKRKKGDIWIDLNRKANENKEIFVSQIVDSEPNVLPKEFKSALLKQTSGNALFTVELLRSLQERGILVKNNAGKWTTVESIIDWSIMPSKVEGVIEERLNRLEDDLFELLSMASVEGLYFTAQIIARIKNEDVRSLIRVLSNILDKKHHLVVETGIERLGSNILSKYEFSHALVQGYMYQQLSEGEKILLHGEISEIIEEYYEDNLDTVSVRLGFHYDKAMQYEKAIGYYDLASSQAMTISAYEEALNHTTRALELIKNLEKNEDRDYQELRFQVKFSTIIRILKGWSTEEAESAHSRALKLCTSVDATPELFSVLFGIWLYNLIKGNVIQCNEVASRCYAMAEEIGDLSINIQANLAMGNSRFWLSKFEESLEYVETIFRIYDPAKNQSYLVDYGFDPRIAVYMFGVWIPWLKGLPKTADQRNEEMLHLAKELNHPLSTSIAYTTASWYYQFISDVDKTRLQAEALIRISIQNKFPAYLPWGHMLRGWALAQDGSYREGYLEILKGERLLEENGGGLKSYLSILLAEACEMGSDLEKALEHVDIGLSSVKKNHELPFEPELLNRKAQILNQLSSENAELSISLFRESIKKAHSSGSRIYGLRAAINLFKFQKLLGEETGETIHSIRILMKNMEHYPDCSEINRGLEILREHLPDKTHN